MTKRAFVLDDEEDMTILTGELLRKSGFEVVTSNNPATGLELLRKTDFDVIVMDLMMPRLGGLEVLRALRSSGRHSKTPIVVFSAKRLEDEERKLIMDYGVRFISKPLAPKNLVAVILESSAQTGDTLR